MDWIDGRANGRIRGFISPAQIDNCTEELLRMSSQASEEMQVPLALHTSQAWATQLESIGYLLMEEAEWIDTSLSVFTDYIEMTEATLPHMQSGYDIDAFRWDGGQQ